MDLAINVSRGMEATPSYIKLFEANMSVVEAELKQVTDRYPDIAKKCGVGINKIVIVGIEPVINLFNGWNINRKYKIEVLSPEKGIRVAEDMINDIPDHLKVEDYKNHLRWSALCCEAIDHGHVSVTFWDGFDLAPVLAWEYASKVKPLNIMIRPEAMPDINRMREIDPMEAAKVQALWKRVNEITANDMHRAKFTDEVEMSHSIVIDGKHISTEKYGIMEANTFYSPNVVHDDSVNEDEENMYRSIYPVAEGS